MLITSPPDTEALEKIAARCNASHALNEVYVQFVRSLARQHKLRFAITSHAAVLALELHAALLLLISRSHFASAHALIRPLMETTARSIWVLYLADFQSVQHLAKGTRKPDLEFLVKTFKRSKIPEISNIGAFLGGMKDLFNSFVHIGVEQLRRREDGFETKEILAGLLISDAIAMVASEVLARIYNSEDLVNFNRQHVASLAREGHEDFGGPAPTEPGRPSLPEVPNWTDLRS